MLFGMFIILTRFLHAQHKQWRQIAQISHFEEAGVGEW